RHDNKYDNWDFLFHKQCFGPWSIERQKAYEDLDRPMNACRYFNRIGSSMVGYYVRDDKKHLVLGWWNDYCVGKHNSLFPYTDLSTKLDKNHVRVALDDPNKLLAEFNEFLAKNNWLNNWWE